MSNTERSSDCLSFKQSTGKSIEILWKIPNYLSLSDSRGFCLVSLPFIFENADWQIRLYPFYGNATLVRLHSLVSSQVVLCKLSTTLENEDNYGYERYSLFYFGTKSFGICYSSVPKISTIKKYPNSFLQDGTLLLKCHLLSEESTEELNQKCKWENYYHHHDVQNKSNFITLKSSSVQCFKIMWDIPDFFSSDIGRCLLSPPFAFGCAKWLLKLQHNNLSTDVSLHKSHSSMPSHEIVCTINLTRKKDIYYEAYNRYRKILFDEKLEDPVYSFSKRCELCYYSRTLAPDGKITFFCHIFYEESTGKEESIQKMSLELNSYRTLCQDFKNLLLDGQDYDLTLKVKEKEFRVHRNILKARSQVFMSMLTHDMTEKNCGVINIVDCEPDAMEQLLLYLYSGEIDNLNKNNMLEIYYAADKYDMKSLKEVCRDFIKKALIPSNICEVVQLAMNHSDKHLLEYATEFFINNKKEILVTTEWMAFMKENNIVANELLIKASKRCCCDS